MAKGRWAIFDKEGTHIIIHAVNKANGQMEELDYYASYESAYNALDLMEPEDIDAMGVQIREVTPS